MTGMAGRIAREAAALGIDGRRPLLVHASLRSLGDPHPSPDEVIDGLLAALDGAALVFPTLSYRYCGPDHPRYDVRKTPSNVGALPECFRLREGVLRSVSPTHSCAALGDGAEWLTEGHIQDTTPCGPNSPFRRLMEMGGRVLFLGSGTNCNTSMHAVEELVVPDYLFGEMYDYIAVLSDGRMVKKRCRRHDFAGWAQRYDRLPPLMPEGTLRRGRILDA